MANKSRRGLHLQKNFLQHNAAYLLHKVVKMLHIGFCLNNRLYKVENLEMRVVSHYSKKGGKLKKQIAA